MNSGNELQFTPISEVTDLPQVQFWKPEYSFWMQIGNCLKIPVLKGSEPNWFHRKLQTLILGITWTTYDNS
jgi:hypothetical protein